MRRLLWLCLLAFSVPAAAQPPERLESNRAALDVQDGETLSQGRWTLDADADPDVYTVQLARGERRRVCFVAGPHSLCRTVGEGDSFDFIVAHAGRDYPTRITGRFVPPMAMFDASYRAENRGVGIAVPEVYELVHVAAALTRTARERRLFTGSGTYWRELEAHFGAFANHPLVTAIDARLRADANAWFGLRMNGAAFVYGPDGRIRRSPVYDRTGFPDHADNDLLPLLPLLDAFSADTHFRDFYRAHRAFYDEQIAYYRTQVDPVRMLAWLRGQFPDARPYDGTRILFSPLQLGNQSATWFESQGFRELMVHMDFPYPRTVDQELTPAAAALRRGEYVFTELNHGFINPAAEPLRGRIEAAMGDRALWVTPGTSSDGYGNAVAVFLEHLNWGLVSLYLEDNAPPAERARMIQRIETYMAEGRGFRQFAAFNRALLALYRERPAGTTLAALYPRIVDWFAANRPAPAAIAAAAPQPQSPAEWREAARADIEAAYASFRRQHPGMFDPRGQGFAAQLEAARRAGLGGVAEAGDALGYRRALNRFTAALHDGHAGILLPPLGWREAVWPGFLTVWRGERLLVADGLPAGPPAGAEVIACDGVPLHRAVEEQIFALAGRQAEAGQWELRAPILFMRTPLTAPTKPRRCTFREPGGRSVERALAWTPMPEEMRERQLVASAGPRGTIGLTEPRPGIHVITLPTFEPDDAGRAAYDLLFAALERDRDRIAGGRAILIDLRYNGGGSSDWGNRVAASLWGEAAMEAAQTAYFSRTEIHWRTEPENIARLRGFAANARERGDTESVEWLTARADAMAAAAARGEPLFVQRLATPTAPPPAPRRLPPVYVLINGTCASACLDGVDTFRLFPNVRLIGAPTSADSDYMEVMVVPLPAGRAQLVVPNKVWINRPRAAGAVYRPDIPVTDLIWSTDLFLDRIERDLRHRRTPSS